MRWLISTGVFHIEDSMLSHEELQNFRNLLIIEIFICTTYRNNVNLVLGHFFDYGYFRSVRAITYFKRQVSAMSAFESGY